jgi:hypothetical protein
MFALAMALAVPTRPRATEKIREIHESHEIRESHTESRGSVGAMLAPPRDGCAGPLRLTFHLSSESGSTGQLMTQERGCRKMVFVLGLFSIVPVHISVYVLYMFHLVTTFSPYPDFFISGFLDCQKDRNLYFWLRLREQTETVVV